VGESVDYFSMADDILCISHCKNILYFTKLFLVRMKIALWWQYRKLSTLSFVTLP